MNETNKSPIFVSYSKKDIDRASILVNALTDEEIDVFWDGNIEAGKRWRNVIPDAIHKAAAVVTLWTKSSVNSKWVLEETELAENLKILLPVMFEGNITIPFGFKEIQCINLSGWSGERNSQFNLLADRLHVMIERRKHGPNYQILSWDMHTFDQAEYATSELQQLSGTIQELGEILATNRPVVKDVNAALDEVAKTYRAVQNAINSFLSPIVETGDIDGTPYIQMESGSLESTIMNGRGHCTRVLTLYRRHRGLRDAIKDRVDTGKLVKIDDAFDSLGVADGDLFEELSGIGWRLTSEADVIVTLLAAGRSGEARSRLLDDREKLRPIRERLKAAINELQNAQEILGYAESSDN